jgi:hypothetical protein
MRTRITHDGKLLATLDADLVALAERQLTRWPEALLRDLQVPVAAAGPIRVPSEAGASLNPVPATATRQGANE